MFAATLSLKSKVTLAVAVLVSAILVLVACLIYGFWHAELRTTIATQQDAMVTALADQLDEKLSSAQEQLTHFARRVDAAVLRDPRRLKPVMDQEDDVRVLFGGGLQLFSPTGAILGTYPATAGAIGRDCSATNFFRKTIATRKPFISAPFVSSDTGKTVIAFTVPIFAGDKTLAAILVGNHPLDSSRIFSSLRDFRIGKSGYLYIIDTDRNMVLHPDPKRIMEVVPPGKNPGHERTLVEGFDGTIENTNSRGLKGLASFRHLTSANWILVANNPLVQAYAPLQRGLGYAAWILAGGILLSIAISRFVMNRLMAPLLALTSHVRAYTSKEGDERFFHTGVRDEIGQLGEAFNDLVTRLDEQNRAIREAADTYRVVAEFNTELAFWSGEDGSMRYISPNCAAMTGHDEREFYATPDLLDSIVHPDDRQEWREYLRKTARENVSDALEMRIVTRDGSIRWLSHACHHVYGAQGQPLGMRGSFIDITMIKLMRQTIEEEKRFFGSLIQNAAAPMFVIDSSHTIIFWNNAMARLTGRSSFQMVGTKRQWEPFYPKKRPVLADLVLDQKLDALPQYYSIFRSASFSDHAYRAEGWYDKLGGERRYIFFEAAPITDAENRIVAAVEALEDITDRKLAQEALNSHILFLQEILDAIPAPIFYKEVAGGYIGCNKAFLSFHGRTPEEVLGKSVFDLLPTDQAAENDAQDRRIIDGHGSVSYETDVRRGDGAIRTVLQTKAAFSRPDGSIGGVVGTFVDITDQRRLDEQIRKMSIALEQSPVSIIITDIRGTIEYVNPAFCSVTGYTWEEIIGQNPRILKTGELTPDEYDVLWQTINAGKEWRGVFHNKRKDGSLYWEAATICPLTDKNGAITNFLAVKEDITARKEAEEALARSQMELMAKHQEMGLVFSQMEMAKREWEDTLDCLRDFVILTDCDHRVRRCNRLLCDITSRSFFEVVGHDWRELLTGSGFEFTTFDGTRGELVHKRSGHFYDLNIYTINELDSEEVSGLVVSLNDTTEIRAITEELQRTSQELSAAQHAVYQQEKMASIGQLAAGVAHEINNPMGFISSNLSTLNKYTDRLREYIAAQQAVVAGLTGSEDADRLADLRKRLKVDMILDDTGQLIAESLEGAGRVRRIVQDLKSFSRVDQAESSVVDINECLETTINIAWNEIKYIASLKREFGELPPVKCFPQQLNQVFLNLLVNAAQALQEQGEITVRTWAAEEQVFISVKDTGVGMPPEVVPRIFEPFYTTKEVGKGTGLGLSISYDIIRKHNGTISVDSVPGAGTTFTIQLPVGGAEG